MPNTHRPSACRAGASGAKLPATVEKVPGSSTTGRSSEAQDGSFTPGRCTSGSADDVVPVPAGAGPGLPGGGDEPPREDGLPGDTVLPPTTERLGDAGRRARTAAGGQDRQDQGR